MFSNSFLRGIIDFNFFLKKLIFFTISNDGKFKVWRRKSKSRYKKSFYTKKEQNDTEIKDISNIFRLKKKKLKLKI